MTDIIFLLNFTPEKLNTAGIALLKKCRDGNNKAN